MNKKITRKEAIKKVGLTALAASSFLLLSTPARAQGSGGNPGGNPGNNKDVGNAGENPNGSGNLGSGDKGQSQ